MSGGLLYGSDTKTFVEMAVAQNKRKKKCNEGTPLPAIMTALFQLAQVTTLLKFHSMSN